MANTVNANPAPKTDWVPLYDINWNVTTGLWDKPTSDNCLIATAQKVVYIVASIFTAVLETLANILLIAANGILWIGNTIHDACTDKKEEPVVNQAPVANQAVAQQPAVQQAPVENQPALQIPQALNPAPAKAAAANAANLNMIVVKKGLISQGTDKAALLFKYSKDGLSHYGQIGAAACKDLALWAWNKLPQIRDVKAPAPLAPVVVPVVAPPVVAV